MPATREGYDGPERRDVPEEYRRRVENIERMLDNGRFLRRDIFEVVLAELHGDFARIDSELGAIRKTQADERKAREDDRRGVRNLVLAAMLSAGFSLFASLAAVAITRSPVT